MTKRLTIALLALAVFVVLAVLPVSAASVSNAQWKTITQGDTLFVGESGLNLPFTAGTQVAWWTSGSSSANAPDKIVTITTPSNFAVTTDPFEDRTVVCMDGHPGCTCILCSSPVNYDEDLGP